MASVAAVEGPKKILDQLIHLHPLAHPTHVQFLQDWSLTKTKRFWFSHNLESQI